VRPRDSPLALSPASAERPHPSQTTLRPQNQKTGRNTSHPISTLRRIASKSRQALAFSLPMIFSGKSVAMGKKSPALRKLSCRVSASRPFLAACRGLAATNGASGYLTRSFIVSLSWLIFAEEEARFPIDGGILVYIRLSWGSCC
jgi:hypothetical protein